MRSPFLLASVSFSIGTLVRILGGPFWVFLLVIPVALFRPKTLLMFSFAFLGFLISFRSDPIGTEVLGRVSSFNSRGFVVSDMRILNGDRWERIHGKALSKRVSVGKRVYCKGIIKTESFPEYSLKKCWDFPIDLSLMDKLKIRVWETREKLLRKNSISLNMALSNPMDVARKAGVSHLFAFSGFHTGVVFYISVLFVSSFFRSMFLIYPVSLIAVVPFIVMSGPSPSAIRAYTMLAFFTASKLLDYPVGKLNILGLSALISIISDPYIIFSPSFVLSYSATFGVMMAMDDERWWKVPIYAYVFSLPAILIFFRELNVVSPVVSILLSPLSMLQVFVAEIATASAFFGGFGFSDLLISGLSPVDKLVEKVLVLFSKFPTVELPLSVSVVLSFVLIWLIGKLLRESSGRSFGSTNWI